MPTRGPTILLLLAGLALQAPIGSAQAAGSTAPPAMTMPPPGMTMPSPDMHTGNLPAAAANPSPASLAYMEAMKRMDQRMAVPMTGNADADFVRGMLPHHQGAVDMAEIELKYGSDPELKRLAHSIILAQRREIAQMQRWLQRHPGAAVGSPP